jgi:hypothetical protein
VRARSCVHDDQHGHDDHESDHHHDYDRDLDYQHDDVPRWGHPGLRR